MGLSFFALLLSLCSPIASATITNESCYVKEFNKSLTMKILFYDSSKFGEGKFLSTLITPNGTYFEGGNGGEGEYLTGSPQSSLYTLPKDGCFTFWNWLVMSESFELAQFHADIHPDAHIMASGKTPEEIDSDLRDMVTHHRALLKATMQKPGITLALEPGTFGNKQRLENSAPMLIPRDSTESCSGNLLFTKKPNSACSQIRPQEKNYWWYSKFETPNEPSSQVK